jgi:hypothetical protein
VGISLGDFETESVTDTGKERDRVIDIDRDKEGSAEKHRYGK